jgi:hypothetical protein
MTERLADQIFNLQRQRLHHRQRFSRWGTVLGPLCSRYWRRRLYVPFLLWWHSKPDFVFAVNQFFVYRVTLPGASIPDFINKKLTPSARARARRIPARMEGTY